MTLRCKELAGGRKSLYIDHVVGGRHNRSSLALYLVPEAGARERRANLRTLRTAQSILRKRRDELLAEQLRRAGEPASGADAAPLLADWLQRYGEAQQRRGVRSLTRLHTVRQRLIEYAPEARIDRIDKAFVAGFIDYLRSTYRTRRGTPLAPKTLFNMIGVFSSALSRAVGEGLLACNPYLRFERTERVRSGRERKREYLTIDELKQLIATPCSSPAVQRIFLFACFTGLRLSDVRRLRWCDLSREEGALRLGIRMHKTDKIVYFPLSRSACKWMPARGRRPADAAIFTDIPHDYNGRIAAWVHDAGIAKHITHHCGRHTYATMLLTLGVDIYTVSKLLGHSSLRHTQRYAQIVDWRMSDAVNLADRVFGPAAGL